MSVNIGYKGVLVAGGVGAGKILMWHVVEKRWSGAEAAAPLAKGLQASYPGKRTFRVLEDNDPSGYQTKLAKVAKAKAHIERFTIAKRSPDLNVLDYCVWANVEKKLREQERRWPGDRRETRHQFIIRLRRVVRNYPAEEIQKAIGDLARRTELLFKAKGGLFDESAEL